MSQNSWPAVPASANPGTISQRYQLAHALGEGGFARVFYAWDTRFQPPRSVALKLLHPHLLTDAEVCRDLTNEAGLMAGLNHPNILKILDFEFAPTQAYIVTEVAEGGSLDSLVHPAGKPVTPLPLPQALRYLEPVAEALDEAHRAGIIHRDIKPKNILLNRSGQPLLADFGLAMTINHSVALKTLRTVFGTPEYTAPEVWEDKVGKASDIYALGIVLFEMLAGQTPFQGSLPALLKQHLQDTPPTLQRVNPGLSYPAGLDSVIAAALAKEPARRPRSALEFIREVRQVYEQPRLYPSPWIATPVQAPGPAATLNNTQSKLAQLPLAELVSELSAELSTPQTVGKWRRATRLGGKVVQHTYRHKAAYLDALHELRSVIKPASPRNQPDTHFQRGLQLFERGDLRRAEVAFSQALQLNSPADGEYLYWRGRTRLALQNRKAAYLDFEQAARMGHREAIAALKALRHNPPSVIANLKTLWQHFRRRARRLLLR
ncbi:MAG TPA: serine/threonine-protein kinase [Chloroflexia bacterium]|nr:serine/threonine-protein kinase [Chloroflexia bacterium]